MSNQGRGVPVSGLIPANQDTTKLAKTIKLKGKVKYHDSEKSTTLVLHFVWKRLNIKNNDNAKDMHASVIGDQPGKRKLSTGIDHCPEVPRLKNGALEPIFTE